MFFNVFFIKVKKHVFYVFFSKINVFIIYGENLPIPDAAMIEAKYTPPMPTQLNCIELSCVGVGVVYWLLSVEVGPNFGFGFGAECGQMGTFGGHSVSAESSRTTFSALSVSECCSW